MYRYILARVPTCLYFPGRRLGADTYVYTRMRAALIGGAVYVYVILGFVLRPSCIC
uniref:Uncharacterized protein n=1 Tax=Arundo donax TaxID=35708 RepID=A0A0A8ZNJ4_ARUDO